MGTTKPKVTPMMQQYESIKKDYEDCLLFFRMGDFYEMFGEDAKKASGLLNIVLTARSKGDHKTPMCGVPFHAAFKYIAKLTRVGQKVAICDQVGDPKEPGLVERKVVKVVTPGTTFDDNLLDNKSNNYLLAIMKKGDETFTISYADVTTGEFVVQEINDKKDLIAELARVIPSECIVDTDLYSSKFIEEIRSYFPNTYFYKYELFKDPTQILLDHFKTSSLKGFGIEGNKEVIKSAGYLLQYLIETQKHSMDHFQKITLKQADEFMPLDESTIRNLELFRTLREASKEGSLYSILDKTITPMGGRMLKKWLSHPLLKKEGIVGRHDAIEELISGSETYSGLQEILKQVHDLERLIGKLSVESGNARDLVALKDSLLKIPELKKCIKTCKSGLIQSAYKTFNELPKLTDLIEKAIINEPPLALKDAGMIKDGYNKELDELRKIANEGKTFIKDLQEQEIKRTGINSLKVKFNRVFGYYIEISKTNLANVPEDYIRKQTLVNAERFITPALKVYEDKILNAEDKMIAIEYKLFSEIREKSLSYMSEIQENAQEIALLDVLQSFASCAIENKYIRPTITDDTKIDIKNGRHPVIEKIDFTSSFIPNDSLLDADKDQLLLITGPNMGGKSTYLRQVALIVLLAQIGSFVPADEAEIGIVDRIFTRVGASDNLIKGESTFMVEMQEAANILNNATDKSLVILDEIGRGTSTYDGVSIAWAITEFLHNKIKAKTLFATHYHELIALADNLDAAKNYSVLVKEKADGVVFLYKIQEGGVDRSYGIEVAKLAGLPGEVIEKSQEILKDLEEDVVEKGIQKTLNNPRKKVDENQTDIFNTTLEQMERDAQGIKEVKTELDKIDVNNLTPMEALQKLDELKRKTE